MTLRQSPRMLWPGIFFVGENLDENGKEKLGDAGEGPASGSLSGRGDAELVAFAKEGKTGAFDELMKRYAEKVHRLTFKILRHEQDAEDAMQDAFLSAFRNLPRFQEKSTFSTWLYRVAMNAALMKLRKRREGMVSLEQPSDRDDRQTSMQIADWARSPVEDLMDLELSNSIHEAILGLPEELQTVFVLREFEGMSNKATADELGLTIPAVKSRLHRARVDLRNRLAHFFANRTEPRTN